MIGEEFEGIGIRGVLRLDKYRSGAANRGCWLEQTGGLVKRL